MTDLQRAVAQYFLGFAQAGLTHVRRPPRRETPAPPPPGGGATGVPGRPPSQTLKAAQRVAFQRPEEPSHDMARSPAPGGPVPRVAPNQRPNSASKQARSEKLQEISQCVAGCTRCPELAATRTQTVFGVGNPRAKVMYIGEAPGADEDRTGEPFVGRAGQLLDKITEACGWKREEIYICNVLRCRPPGNRLPTWDEADNCREYLDGQIAIVDPEYIVCWGTCAAQNLLGTKDAIGKLRQRFYQYGRAKVLCTYHPSYLLRNPAAKKPVWDDMKLLLAEMGLKPPSAS